MQEESCVMLRLLLNRYGGGEREKRLKILHEEDAKRVLSVPIDSQELHAYFKSPQETLQRIHYSWLLPKIKEVEKDALPVILSLLPEPHATKLRQALRENPPPLQLSSTAKRFLADKLLPAFKLEEALPREYLPQTEMTPLLDMEKNTLLDLIDYLGLYDLAEEIQHIVDKHLLEQIYRCLPAMKKKFLRVCLHQKEKLTTQRLQLEHWDGDCIKLSKLLHHKGLVRLGYALSGQHKDIMWHVAHILDIGRGQKLYRYFSGDSIAGITDTLQKQVRRIMIFFKQESKSE